MGIFAVIVIVVLVIIMMFTNKSAHEDDLKRNDTGSQTKSNSRPQTPVKPTVTRIGPEYNASGTKTETRQVESNVVYEPSTTPLYAPGDISDTIRADAEQKGFNFVVSGVFELKGLYYRSDFAKSVANKLRQGEMLKLVPENNNPHDKYAVRVLTEGGCFIGYVPAECSESINRNLNNIIQCCVSRRKTTYTNTYINVFIRSYCNDNHPIHGLEYQYIEQLHDYFREGASLKIEGKYEEAAERFIKSAYSAYSNSGPDKSITQACICYRKAKLYEKEKELISVVMKDKRIDISEKTAEDLLHRMESVEKFIEKK